MGTTETVQPAPLRAERVEVGGRTRSRLTGADYADAFRVRAGGPHPAEAWARRTFESGPPARRRLFGLIAWRGVLGMRLGPEGSRAHIAGWAIVVNEAETVVLHVDSWMLVARLVIDVSDSHATMTTLLRYERREARAVWAAAGIAHRALAPVVLGGAARSLARRS